LLSISLSPILVTTSSTRRPALAAGEPGTTSAMTAPFSAAKPKRSRISDVSVTELTPRKPWGAPP
jgi:hypothetical protein